MAEYDDVPRPQTSAGVVVMAVHRPRRDLLETQLRSLQEQTLRDWVCVVGIDGQDDVTEALVEELIGDDPRFATRCFPDNVGVYRHFERLLADIPADARWVALADQDDRWDPEKLAVLTSLLADGATAVEGQARVVDDAGRRLGTTYRHEADLGALLLKNQLTGGFAVLHPDVVRAALPFPPATAIAIHDHWLAVVAAALGRIRVHDGVLQDYVQHGGNVLGEERGSSWAETRQRVRQHHGLIGFLDHVSEERWGWRVEMARALLVRQLPLGRDLALVSDIAESRLSRSFCRALHSAVRSGDYRLRTAAGSAVAAWRYRRSRR